MILKSQWGHLQLEGPSCHSDGTSPSPLIINTETLSHTYMHTRRRLRGAPLLSRASVSGCASSPAATTSLCSNNQLFFWLCFSSGEVIRFLECGGSSLNAPPTAGLSWLSEASRFVFGPLLETQRKISTIADGQKAPQVQTYFSTHPEGDYCFLWKCLGITLIKVNKIMLSQNSSFAQQLRTKKKFNLIFLGNHCRFIWKL